MCMGAFPACIFKRAPYPTVLELQIVVSCHVYWELNPGPLQEQPVLLTAEPPIQPLLIILLFCLWFIDCMERGTRDLEEQGILPGSLVPLVHSKPHGCLE